MVHTLPAIANPLAPAVELARSVPMQIVAATVGALVGVALFAVMTLVVARRRQRPAFQAAATDVVFIPPYPAVRRQVVSPPTPLPPRGPASVAPVSISHEPRRSLGFVPSTALSARAFAKMGYSFVAQDGAIHEGALGAASPVEELASTEPRALGPCAAERAAEVRACSPASGGDHGSPDSAEAAAPESIPCVVESLPAASSPAIETGPMSAVTMSTSASILAAAPIADLDLDDGPTELCEPYFDEPPQVRGRVAPPKIRRIPPSPPRHPRVEPTERGMLPVDEVERAPATLRWRWMPPPATQKARTPETASSKPRT